MTIGDSTTSSPAFRFLVMTASFIVIVAGMKAAKSILVPFLLSIFISIICSPLLFWLRRKKLPLGLSLILVICGILGIGFLVGMLVGSSLNDFSQSLPLYQARLQDKTAVIVDLLGRMGISFSDKLLLEYIDPGAAMNLASMMLSGIGTMLSKAFLIFVTVIFILLEAAAFPEKLKTAFGPTHFSMKTGDDFVHDINRYMTIKTWVSLATGVLVSVWLAILGVDYPVLWGLLAFIFNYVPNIGSIIAAVPAILLAFVQLGLSSALLTAAGYVILNIVMGNVIEPRFMGRGLGLSTLVVFLSLVFWGWVLGPIGMVLSIPLTMTLKIAFSSVEETRWLGTLLGTAPIPEPVKE
jgi:AI-2 transport protein TqsA